MDNRENYGSSEKATKKVLELTPEELEKREKLVVFLQSFVKSMMQTGYYSADHPLAQKAKEGLYDAYRELLGDGREVSFMAHFEKGKGKDIFIDGIMDEPTSLNVVMSSSQSELFLPKFTEYFHRRGLVSFSLKNEISAYEFERFVEVMSESKRAEFDSVVEKGTELTKELVDNQIVHVSTVFDDDIIKIGRKVPWRVEMALLRLRKDLGVVPMFRHLDEEQIGKIKKEVVEDIIRPISHPDLFTDILLNAEYVVEDVGTLRDMDIEAEIISCIKPFIIGPVTEKLADKLPDKNNVSEDSEETTEIIKRILRKLGERMVDMGAEDAIQSMYRLHDLGVLKFDQLPESLQNRIQMEKTTVEFIVDYRNRLQTLRETSIESEYENISETIGIIFEELVKRDEFKIIAEAVDILSSHWGEENPPFEERPDLAMEMLDTIATHKNRSLLMETLDDTSREGRQHILRIFGAFGPQSIPDLLLVLGTSEDVAVRKSITQSIGEMGNMALPALVDALKKPDQPWFLIRNIVGIMGDIGAKRAASEVSGYLTHEHPRVREESMVSLVKLLGSGAEPALVHALKDNDENVQIRAVVLLGSIKSRHTKVMEFYNAVLTERLKVTGKVQSQVCRSLGLLGEVEFPDGVTSTDLLRVILERGQSKKFFGLIKSDEVEPASTEVRLQAVFALAKTATPKAFETLGANTKDKDPDVRKAIEDALNRGA